MTGYLFRLYEHYINLTDVPYQFCSVYYLEEKNLARCLERFDDYCRKNMPEVERYAVYIQNVLLVFFPNFETSYVQLDSFFKSLDFPGQTVIRGIQPHEIHGLENTAHRADQKAETV